MAKRRGNDGAGGISKRGENSFRLRYRIGDRRFAKTIQVETREEAEEELARILGNKAKHVAPSKMTLAQWIEQWLQLLKRTPTGSDRKRGLVNPRTLERYGQLLKHAKDKYGAVKLQKLTGTMIDELYMELEQKLAVRTVLHLHNVLRPCLAKAVKKKEIPSNPADDASRPRPDDPAKKTILSEAQLAELVRGFRGHPIEMIVDIAACTGARRNEIIALRWSDINFDKNRMTIERSVEQTIAHGKTTKEPKTGQRGVRTIAIDSGIVARLRAYRDVMKRRQAGLADDAEVDLGLIRLAPDAILFPGEDGGLRDGHAVTRTFRRHAASLGFDIKFHWIRAAHLTFLLNKGETAHVVAARAGHDPVTLLRSYAQWTEEADAKVANSIEEMSLKMV